MKKFLALILMVCSLICLCSCTNSLFGKTDDTEKHIDTDDTVESAVTGEKDDDYDYICVVKQYDEELDYDAFIKALEDKGYTVNAGDGSPFYDENREYNPVKAAQFHSDVLPARNVFFEFENAKAAETIYNYALQHDERSGFFFFDVPTHGVLGVSFIRIDKYVFFITSESVLNFFEAAGIEDHPDILKLQYHEDHGFMKSQVEYNKEKFTDFSESKGYTVYDMVDPYITNAAGTESFVVSDEGMVICEIISPEFAENEEFSRNYAIANEEWSHAYGHVFVYTANGYLIHYVGGYFDELFEVDSVVSL